MRLRLPLSFAAFFLLPVPMQGQDYSVEDIISVLEDTEREIRSLIVTSSSDVLFRYFPNNPGQEVITEIEERIVVTSDGRVRVQRNGENFRHGTPPQVYDERSVSVFDGEVMKSMEGLKAYRHGLVTSSRSDAKMQLDPRYVSTHYFGKPVTELLLSRGCKITGTTEWDGHAVIQVDTDPRGESEKRRYRFLIAPDLNFAILRRAIAVQYPGTNIWQDYTQISGYDFHEEHPGVWLPSKAIHQSLEATPETAKTNASPEVSWEWNVELTDWEVNAEMKDSMFELDFSPGVYVNDKITGNNYQTAGISDELLKELAETGNEFQETGTPLKKASWQKYLLIANAVAFVVIAVLLTLKKLKKPKNNLETA